MTFRIRAGVRDGDRESVERIVRSTGFFNAAEIEVALELVDAWMDRGEASGYRFLFADGGDDGVGYSCYGPIAGTAASWDLYWIAVHANHRGHGVGRQLMVETLAAIRRERGTRVYAETSTRSQYESTRRFYLARGFREAARLADFYAPGDGKLIYELSLDRAAASPGHVISR